VFARLFLGVGMKVSSSATLHYLMKNEGDLDDRDCNSRFWRERSQAPFSFVNFIFTRFNIIFFKVKCYLTNMNVIVYWKPSRNRIRMFVLIIYSQFKVQYCYDFPVGLHKVNLTQQLINLFTLQNTPYNS